MDTKINQALKKVDDSIIDVKTSVRKVEESLGGKIDNLAEKLGLLKHPSPGRAGRKIGRAHV